MQALHGFLAAAALLAGCATPPEPALVVPLAAAPGNAGAVGRATLTGDASRTRIEVFFTAAGAQPTLPLHVYTYLYEGSCGALPQQAAYSLNRRVLVETPNGNLANSRRGAFTLSHELDVPLSQLLGGRYALALRASPQDGGALLYCGDVARA